MKHQNSIPNTLLLPVTLWVIGLLFVYHPILFSGFTLMQTDPGDTRLNNYFLEHGYFWLNSVQGHQEFWNMPFFYPEKNTAAFSDILLGVAPFYWIWRVAGLAADTSYQMWLLTIASLNYLSFYLLLSRQFKLTPLASSLGAFLFAFGCVRTSELYHSQMIAQFYSVLAIFALTNLFFDLRENTTAKKRFIYMPLFFGSITLQIYSGFYNGWFFVFALSLAFVISMLFPYYRKLIVRLVCKYPILIVFSLVGSGLLLLPMGLHYYDASQKLGIRVYSMMIEPSIPRPLSWFSLGSENWFFGWADGLVSFKEHRQVMGVGYITLIVSCLGLWRRRNEPICRILSLTTLLVIGVSTIFPGGVTVWKVIYDFYPGAEAIRYVSRISLLLLIPASFGLAFFVQHLQKRKIWVAFLLGVLCLLEQGTFTSSYEKQSSRKRVASLVSQIDSDCESFLLMIQGNRRFLRVYHLDAMWAANESGVPTINGYSGASPQGWYFSSIVDLNEQNGMLVNGALNKWAYSKNLDRSKICTILQDQNVILPNFKGL